jgi:hypothetical protein
MKKSRVIIFCSLMFLVGSSLGYIAGVWHGCAWPSLWKDWESAFHFQSLPQQSVKNDGHYALGLGVAGTTREDTVAMLTGMNARVLTNTAKVIVAEYGPEGFLSSDGKPLTQPVQMQLRFRDGKLVQATY